MTLDDLIALVDDEGRGTPGADEVAAFEALIGARLPDDYRAFLARTPGGYLHEEVPYTLTGDWDTGDRVKSVSGLRAEGYLSLERCVREAADLAIPEGLIAIMTDAGGNEIALAVRPDRLGEIFFLDHEIAGHEDRRPTLEEAESDGWGYALPLASSFSALIAGFRTEQPHD